MNTPKSLLECQNCDKWLGKTCPETGVALPCSVVTQAIVGALGGVSFERGFDTSSDAEIAGRFVQHRTFPELRQIGEQACSSVLADIEITA